MNIPNVIEVSAVFFRINWVTKFTVNTTTSGFTLAYQEGEAPSPAKRKTYFRHGCIQLVLNHPETGNNKDQYDQATVCLQTLISAVHICPKVFLHPECWLLL